METIQQTSITKEQREVTALLSIGTFLEYFDLMLYVHMAVLLNSLFFPKTDALTSTLLASFAFCSTFVFRPIGALFFGWMGDKIGRKPTVIITTFIMAIACFTIASLPTYAQIGVTAAWIITICRIVQGISSMGEIVGAELYLTEMSKPPVQYPLVALIGVCGAVGSTAALGIASLTTSFGLNWRLAFFIGGGIALVGTIARTSLRETPEFADAKRRVALAIENAGENSKELLTNNNILKEKVNKKTAAALFLLQCAWPVGFYFVYIHYGNVLKNTFHFTPEQIIHQNFIVSIVQLISFIAITYLCYYIHPLKILIVKFYVSVVLVLISPWLLNYIDTPFYILLLQSLHIAFWAGELPAGPVLFRHLPVFKRFTYASFTFAAARAIMYVITSFGISYLVYEFGSFGLWIVIVPVYSVYLFGLLHFKKLEIETGNYKKIA